MTLRYLTGGESHGRLLLGIVEGIPSGLPLTAEAINIDLARRQRGYGRGGRMRIEKDQVEIVAGVRHGKTLGGPLGLMIQNKDWENWQQIMSVTPNEAGSTQRVVTKPRPGHADLVGAIKYGHEDIRNVLEKASARETAIRVAVGAVAKQLLEPFGMKVISHVVEIGGVRTTIQSASGGGLDPEEIFNRAEESEVRCADPQATEQIMARIKEAKLKGDTLGGVFEIVVTRPPIGLGSYSQWDRRLNARLAMALMSIQAIKGVEIGLGFEVARRFGSEVHDEIFYNKPKGKSQKSKEPMGFYRRTNNAGGIEGGVTNGENIILRAAMKPIATLYAPLKTVDIVTKEPFKATVERSDVCSVPAAGVVGEAVVAFEMAAEMIRKFGGDSLAEMIRNYEAYIENVKNF